MPQFLVIFPAFVAAFSFQKLFFCIVCRWYHRRLTTIAVVWFCSTLLSPRNWWQMSDFLNILMYLTPPSIFWNGEMKGLQKQLCYLRSRSVSPNNTKCHTFLSYNSVPNSKLHLPLPWQVISRLTLFSWQSAFSLRSSHEYRCPLKSPWERKLVVDVGLECEVTAGSAIRPHPANQYKAMKKTESENCSLNDVSPHPSCKSLWIHHPPLLRIDR